MLKLEKLPPRLNFNTSAVLNKAIEVNKDLEELKGYFDIIPDKNRLLNAITIDEAKESSEIEYIITTHDELYKALSTNQKCYNEPYHKWL